MSDRIYTSADGVALKPGDTFYQACMRSSMVRTCRVGKTRRKYRTDEIPTGGISSVPAHLAFSTFDGARNELIDHLRSLVASNRRQIEHQKEQIKRDEKAIRKLEALPTVSPSLPGAEGEEVGDAM